jgi:hypothetical protein
VLRVSLGPRHFANEMNNRVTIRDKNVEPVQRAVAVVLEVFLHLHVHIVPREVGVEQVAIVAEFVGNRREKNRHRHESASAIESNVGTISQGSSEPKSSVERGADQRI